MHISAELGFEGRLSYMCMVCMHVPQHVCKSQEAAVAVSPPPNTHIPLNRLFVICCCLSQDSWPVDFGDSLVSCFLPLHQGTGIADVHAFILDSGNLNQVLTLAQATLYTLNHLCSPHVEF